MAEFAMLGGALALVAFAVIQLSLVLHARNVMIDAAGEGAREAALYGNTDSDGEALTRELITRSLGPKYARQIEVKRVPVDGAQGVAVTVSAPAPALLLLPAGPEFKVTGHAIAEAPPAVNP